MAKVKIRVTRSGLYGADGMIPVGTTFSVEEDKIPREWKGKVEVLSKKAADAEPVVNPASLNVSTEAQAAGATDAEADAKAAAEKAAADAKAASDKEAEDKAKADADAAAKKATEAKKLPGQK